MEFPILHDPGSVELLINTLFRNEPPKLVDHDYLIGLGFKREVDEGLLMLLTFLGLIDDNGQPSDLWIKSRDPDQAVIMLGRAVKAAYGSLYNKFPNAYQEKGSVLMEYFRVETGDSDPNIAYMILTFKVLCDLAGLNEVEPAAESPEPVRKPAAKLPEPVKKPAEELPEPVKKPVEELPEPVKKPAAVKKPDTRKKRKPAEKKKSAAKKKSAETEKQDAGPVVGISINIDIDDKSDPDMKDLVMKLLKRQLEL
ncbi:MAG: DUF5343 domain-containing protein [Candidatus Aegiribacteria sp.]|nr:DUF5343 domain-containing protein [Candidatus Aegiribacteria sp.]